MDIEKANELLENEKYDELLEIAEQEIAMHPDSVEGYLYKSYCIADKDELLACYDKILELKPDDFEILGAKARSLYSDKKYKPKEIIEYCDNVIAKFAYSAGAYLMKAKVLLYLDLFSIKNYEKMITETCQKAIELEPDNIEAYNLLGDTYMDEYEYEKSRDCYKKVLELDENDYNANYGIVMFIYNTEGVKKAVEYCDNLINQKPEDFLVYNIKFSFLTHFTNLSEYEGGEEAVKSEVERLFRKLISYEEAYLWSLYNDLGWFYENELNNNDAAISLYREAIDKIDNEGDKKWFEDKIKELQDEKLNEYSPEDKYIPQRPLPMYDNNRGNNINGLLMIIIIAIILFAAYFYFSGGNIK